MKVLVTGFDPFGGESINPAWEAIKCIRNEIAGAEIVTMQIPTVVGRSIERIHEKMKELQPDMVISVGQAGGRFGVTPEGAEIVTMQIPTVVGRSIERIHEKMKELQPDMVISVGQAGGRFGVTPERVAINITDARIPDNEGNQPIDEPVFADGDAAYFSNLPVKAMVQAIKDAGYPSSLSNSAGTYICNHVMYGILYYIYP